MNISEKVIKLIPEFFKITLNEENFESVIFGVLDKIFSIKSGYIFFDNSEELSLRYSFNSQLSDKTLSASDFEKFVDGDKCLVSDLYIEAVPYAKLLLVLEENADTSTFKVFESISSIVSNLVKDLEISAILKMQVDALNDGMCELVKANKKILAAEKTKNDFYSNVSHQLRSPLNSIIGFTDILNSEFVGSLNEAQKNYISDIKISGIKLLEMVNEILDISKIESNSMKLFKRNFSLAQNIQEVLNILKPLYLEKNITVEMRVSNEIELFADFQKIQQVFFNLISNAIKFTDIGGNILISSIVEDNEVMVSVKDNGIGIEKKYHKKIFKKFQQVASQDGSSTGLGLPIADKIVKLHGGKILLNSELGKGSEFTVCIPLG